jgi:DNA-binding transcriptional MocR family regulator
MANQLKMAEIDAIRAPHERNWSIRRIAKELGVHRDTVSRYVHGDGAEAKQAGAPLGSSDSQAADLPAADGDVPTVGSGNQRANGCHADHQMAGVPSHTASPPCQRLP